MWSSCQIIGNKNKPKRKEIFQVYDKIKYGNMGWKKKDSPILESSSLLKINVNKLTVKLYPYLEKDDFIEEQSNYQRVTYNSKGKQKHRYEIKWRTYSM